MCKCESCPNTNCQSKKDKELSELLVTISDSNSDLYSSEKESLKRAAQRITELNLEVKALKEDLKSYKDLVEIEQRTNKMLKDKLT